MLRRQVQEAQSVVSHHQEGNEHGTRSVYKDGQGRGKSDLSPPPPPLKPPLKSVSGVGSRGGDEGRTANELLDIHAEAMADPGETFLICGEKQVPDMDDKDNTMELLKEADMQSPVLEMDTETTFSTSERKVAHKSNAENVIVVVEKNTDNEGDASNLCKRAPTHHNTTDSQVSSPTRPTCLLHSC